jgi:DNA-binding XRE family transcriptional regulator
MAVVKNAPTAQEVRDLRINSGLTQEQAAGLVYLSRSGMQKIEAGMRRMHPGLFELLSIKLGMKDDT